MKQSLMWRIVAIGTLFLLPSTVFAQVTDAKTDTDSVKIKKIDEDLPLQPERTIAFTTKEGTWMSLDISPDGKTIIFDLMGDLYTMPIEGGKAEALTQGMGYDVHPRYSPDGKSIVYISDRSGSENVWIMDLESKEKTQLTKDDDSYFPSAEWSTDGNYIFASKGRRNHKLYMFHKDGGSGIELIGKPDALKVIDVAVTPDGKHVYFSQRRGAWNYNAQLPQYQIGMFDLEKNEQATVTGRYGSAFTPTFSGDGKWMVYGTRFEDKTGLIIRNLKTGGEEWLAFPIQRDDQESIAPLGVLPAMSFTPDSKSLIAAWGGNFKRVDIASKAVSEINFEADMSLDFGPKVEFDYPISDEKEAVVTQIRDTKASPDGKMVAFTALNRLYVMDYPEGTPKRVTNHNFTEAMPSWSPDGEYVVFVGWDEENGGHVYKSKVKGRKQKTEQLTKESGLYVQPMWSYKSDRIVFMRGSAQQYAESISFFGLYQSLEDLVWISSNGGELNFITKAYEYNNPHFTKSDDRIYLNSGSEGLVSIRFDGTDLKKHAQITGIRTYGSNWFLHFLENKGDLGHTSLHPDLDMRENNPPSSASEIYIAPEGDQVLALINNDIYVATLPKIGEQLKISVANPAASQFPARKLTTIGGQFPSWSGDAKSVNWSIGNAFFSYNLDDAKVYDDSVKAAKKAEEKKKKEEAEKKKAEKVEKKDGDTDGDSNESESEEAKPEEEKSDKKEDEKKDEKKKDKGFKPSEKRIEVKFNRDIPEGKVLLTGARIITMKGDEVIEKGDILIENHRIKAVGVSGSLDAAGAEKMDMSGKTIVPGFVDPHAHMWPVWGIHKSQDWQYAANLAYGVTTTRDPQTSSTDVLTYSDMVEAGEMVGPRVYSTGPGLGYWGYNLKDLDHARDVMKQYSEYYNTKTIKMYLAGNRKQRQWIIQAAKEQKIMPTTEGGLDFKLNMTQLQDGYPGHEHALPIYPLYKDVIKTIADAQMAVNPTLLVSYGGPWAENYFYSRENPYGDEKLKRFTPYEELASKSRRRPGWFHDDEHVFQKHSEGMVDLVVAGGIVGVGSHGQLQGLGFHWELWSIAWAKMKPLDAIRVATKHGADQIGLGKEIGSLEAGKLADLVILDKNPLEEIRNTNTVRYVMKNGRLYDADTLDEVYPRKKKFENLGFWETLPAPAAVRK